MLIFKLTVNILFTVAISTVYLILSKMKHIQGVAILFYIRIHIVVSWNK